MSVISVFFRIVVRMFYREHGIAHFHVEHQGQQATFTFDGMLLAGTINSRTALRLIAEWALLYGPELQSNWERMKAGQALERIEPLDGGGSMTFLPSVTRAEYRGDYRVDVTFNDGKSGTVDFAAWLSGPVFEPLKDTEYFQRFFIDGGTVSWPNGADVAPETLYEEARSSAAAKMRPLAVEGRVLGIDVGFSPRRKTTCFCVLAWTQTTATFTFQSATSDADERSRALADLRLVGEVSAVAVDGPLTNGLEVVEHYRAAEALLSRGVLQRRGKPGQTSSPVGQQLHRHATALAHLALESTDIVAAAHAEPIHASSLVEAFPNMYLAALVPEPQLPVLSRDASDRYWELLVERSDRLKSLIGRAMPGRELRNDLAAIRDHEHRAGVICALTALSVASGEYVAVGDPMDGDIILPAQAEWGRACADSGSWLEPVLRSNLKAVTTARKCHPNHRRARILNMNQ